MPSKYDAINKLKAKNPKLTWTEAAHQAGFEGEWTSDKGKAKPRTGDARGQARRRASFDQPSTEMAGYEAKQLQQESTRISAEAEMYGLEPTQIEHLADQEDVRHLTAGSAGDPTNKAIVTQTEARFKDRVKQLAASGYSVTLNPTTDSVRVIEQRFFDPIADPTTLPGFDIPIGSDIEKALAEAGVLKSIEAMAPPEPLGGYVSPGLGPGDPFKIFTTAHRPEPVETGTPGTALTLPSLPNTTGPQMTDFKPQTVFNWENKAVSKEKPQPDLTFQLDPNKAASTSFTAQGLGGFLGIVRDATKLTKTAMTAFDVVSGF